MPKRECYDREDQEEAAWHELFGFGEPPREDNQQHGEDDFHHVTLEDHADLAKNQQGCENGRGDERSFASGFEVADQAAYDEEDNVNPQDGVWSHAQEW